ncbi:MAG: hypothetical protein AAFX80_09610, partial [Cyanobacteria bacterium J06639_18]
FRKCGKFGSHTVSTKYMYFCKKFSKLSKKLFSKGLATYLKLQNHENHYEDTIRKYFFNTYLVEKLEIACKTLYYWIRLMSADLV